VGRLVLHCAVLALLLYAYHRVLEGWLERTGTRLGIVSSRLVAPLHAAPEATPPGPWALGAVAALVLVVAAAPRLVDGRLSPGRFLALAAPLFLAVAWSVGLIDGWQYVDDRLLPTCVVPFTHDHLEYVGDVPEVERLGVAEFARRYSKPNFYDRLSLHSRSHPPGPVVFQWVIWKVFGGGAGVAALLTVGFATLMVPLLYLAGRALYGDGPARLAVLLAMTTPSVVMYTVTSMEGVYACFVLAAVALHARARRAGAHAFAVAEGLALAVGTMMTYAVVFVAGMLGLWLLAEGVSRQRAWREVVGQGLGAAAGFALGWVPPLLLGYRPVATLRATFAMNTELLGSAHESLARYAATVSVNLADFAFGLGLVLAVLWSWSLARAVRRRAVDAFAVATLGAIVVMATVSVYHGETARAWMFMAPLLALLAAREAQALGETAGPRGLRALLGLAAVQLFAAEALLSTPW
jgi:hypothetical protein